MKKLIGIIFLSVFISVQAAPIAVISQLTSQGWTSPVQKIEGLNSIAGIIASTNATWMFGNNAHGQEQMLILNPGQTSPLIPCPFKNVYAILPAYPETGAFNTGWTMAANTENQQQSYYYDGREWSKPQAINNLINLTASQGNAWMISTDDAGQMAVSYFDLGSKTWVPIKNLVLTQIAASSAAEGNFYLLANDENGNAVLYKIDGAGHVQEINNLPNFNIADAQLTVLLTDHNNVFIYNIFDKAPQVFYSTNQGMNWHDLSKGAPLANSASAENGFSLVSGIVRIPGNQDAYQAYVDLNQKAASWQMIPLPPNFYAYYTFYPNVSSDGTEHCEFLGAKNGAVTVGCYDITQKTWNISPALPTPTYQNLSDMIAVLGNDKVATVGLDNNNLPAAYYYDGKAWQVKEFPGMTQLVGTLTFQSYYHPENIWLAGSE